MNTLKYFIAIVISSVVLVACASSTPKEVNEKYIFPDLKQVDRILSNRIDSWGEIDKQSLFISTSPNTSYLVILRRPSNDIKFARNLSFRSRGSSLNAKFDSLYFTSSFDSVQAIPVFIDRIYEVKGKKQKKIIRAKILNENLEEDTEKNNKT